MKKILVLLTLLSQVCFGQQSKDIGGTIVDSSGNPIAGATIIDKSDPTNGVISDFNGQFVISVSESSKELEISFLGFESETVTIDGKFVNVKLEEAASQLDGVLLPVRHV